jgi:hypothetical protein
MQRSQVIIKGVVGRYRLLVENLRQGRQCIYTKAMFVMQFLTRCNTF